MKTKLNILLILCTTLAVLTFSSASASDLLPKIKVEKSDKKENDQEKGDTHVVAEFDALISATSFFEPVQLFGTLTPMAPVIVEEESQTLYFELSSQEFFRIFFTHIISKNAP